MTREKSTREGTRRFAERFAKKAANEHFRETHELILSSIGIGTYLGEPDERTDEAYAQAVEAAVEAGINVVDSAINYRFQRSERSIGTALKRLAAKGFQRDEVVICTKGGYLTPDGAMPGDPNTYFFEEYIKPGIFTAKEIAGGSHCMAPRFLENQLNRSLQNLGIGGVDIYYLHNPETQLSDVTPTEFLERVRRAFEYLESAANEGKLSYYGMATWNGFRQDAKARGSMQIGEIAAIAKEVAGDKHRFRFIQLPFNLGMTEALTLGNQMVRGAPRTAMEAAHDLGITLVGSASLMQGQLSQGLPAFVAGALGMESDAGRALQFARSAPGITTALAGMSRVEHVRENSKLVATLPATLDQFSQLFSRE